jgi:tetratricopeptide (TPR) repeat protein
MIGILILVGLLAVEGRAAAEDPLRAAKDLYAAAAYEEALTMLSRIPDSTSPDLARQAAEYRAFCLFALGRQAEAEQTVEALLRKQPLSRLEATDASPRLQQLFAKIRRRLLPSLLR